MDINKEISNIENKVKSLENNYNNDKTVDLFKSDDLEERINALKESINTNTQTFTSLFNRINPFGDRDPSDVQLTKLDELKNRILILRDKQAISTINKVLHSDYNSDEGSYSSSSPSEEEITQFLKNNDFPDNPATRKMALETLQDELNSKEEKNQLDQALSDSLSSSSSITASSRTSPEPLSSSSYKAKASSGPSEEQVIEAFRSFGFPYNDKDPDYESYRSIVLESLQAGQSSDAVAQANLATEEFYFDKLSPYFERVPIKDNGDCFFDAVATQVGDDMNTVRNKIANYLVENRGVYENSEFFEGGFESYVTKLRESSDGKVNREGWGGELEAKIASEVYGRPVNIFRFNDSNLKNDSDGVSPGSNSRYIPTGKEGVPPINLLFNGENHYDSLKPWQ